MRVSYLDAADSEFDEAIAYYNAQKTGLGFEFADEVKEAVERIKNYPDAWTPLSERLRRCQVHRFPYRIIYQVRDDLLLIVAVQFFRLSEKITKARDAPTM